MLHITRSTRQKIILFWMAAMLGGVLHLLPTVFPFIHSSAALYCALILYWGASIRRRILNGAARRCLTGMVALMLGLMLLRGDKYLVFAELPRLQLLSWYGYVIPHMGVALLSFYTALSIGEEPPYPTLRRFLPLLFWWGGASVLYLTNDLHHLAYRFSASDPFHDYTHGPVYWAAVGSTAVLLAASFFIALVKGRRSLPPPALRRRGAALPAAILVVYGLYYLLYYLNGNVVPDLVLLRLFNPPEMLCFVLIGFWESCVQLGLLPSCSGYETIFRVSTLNAQLLSTSGDVVLASQGAGGAVPSRDLLVQERPISGGAVRWTTDLTQVNALNDRLDQSIGALAAENELMAAENALREKRVRLETQNRLYDEISRAVRPQTERITAWLRSPPERDDAAYRRALGRCCVLGAFIKRRANLALLSAEHGALSPDELYYSLRETLEYLGLCGVQTSLFYPGLGTEPSRLLPGEDLIRAYTVFFQAVQAAMAAPSALIVHLGERPLLRLELQGCTDDLAARLTPSSDLALRLEGKTTHLTLWERGGAPL